MFGVNTVANGISRSNAATVSTLARAPPLVATITGSSTTGSPARVGSQSATARAVSALPSIPIFTASTPMSLTQDWICASTMSGGTGITRCTPSVFCAVMAVTAVIAWPPSMETVLMSA